MMQKPFSFNRRRFYVAFSTAAAAALLSLLVFLPQKAADMQSPESSVVQVQALSAPAEAAETEGFGLYIDGVFIAACDERAEIDASLGTLLSMRTAEVTDDCIEAAFVNEVSVVSDSYADEAYVESEELDALLGIESADSFSHTILTYDGSEAEVDISVRATVVEREETVIPYETVEVYNDQRVEGYERVLEEGEEGLSVTDYEAVYVDGELQTRSVLSVRTVEEPVDRQVEYGTIVKTSTFSWPYEGRISSYFGSRTLSGDYNYHNGLDIVAYSGSCYGDPIRAAGDGVVTVARYYDAGGYGKYVVIRHADGTETYYAHMSTVLGKRRRPRPGGRCNRQDRQYRPFNGAAPAFRRYGERPARRSASIFKLISETNFRGILYVFQQQVHRFRLRSR